MPWREKLLLLALADLGESAQLEADLGPHDEHERATGLPIAGPPPGTGIAGGVPQLKPLAQHECRQRIWEAGLSTNATITLLAMSEYADGDGICWPSQDLLVILTRLHKRTVIRAINVLVEAAILLKARRGKPGGGYHMTYRINWSRTG